MVKEKDNYYLFQDYLIADKDIEIIYYINILLINDNKLVSWSWKIIFYEINENKLNELLVYNGGMKINSDWNTMIVFKDILIIGGFDNEIYLFNC